MEDFSSGYSTPLATPTRNPSKQRKGRRTELSLEHMGIYDNPFSEKRFL